MSYKPSPSMIVAIMALVVALGGAAFAAATPFLLGAANTATRRTSLASSVSTQTLALNNHASVAGSAALGLFVKGGHPPMTVSSTGLVTNLNADLLGGLHANELARVGQVNTTNLFGLNATATLAEVTLDIPADGFALVMGNVLTTTASSSNCACGAEYRLLDETAVVNSPVMVADLGTGSYYATTTPIWVFPVTAGTRKFALTAYTYNGGASYNPSITAVYIPYGATGSDVLSANLLPAPEPATPLRLSAPGRGGVRTIIR